MTPYEEFIEANPAVNAISWLLANRMLNENGSPVEFEDHSFLIDPYNDDSEKQAIMKASQIGWSTLAIFRSFHLAKFAKANIIHTFPSRNIAKDFVVPKVDPLIEHNPVLKKMVGVSSAHLKQVGDRFIYYRGTYEQTEAISISAHILINDEYDRSNQKVLKTYRSRLDDAKRERPELGWEWRFSNPSIPGYGVDELWQKSDQKHWFVKCRHCNYDWYLRFPDNVHLKKKIRICSKCGKEIKRDDLIGGRWVNKRNSPISGYWISQMFVPWISAEKIIDDSEGDKEVFHNFTLGLPYISQDAGIGRQAIINCLNPGYNPRTSVAIGVDNGVVKHYVVGNKFGIFQIGVTEDWQDIEDLRNKYAASMVIDSLPYPTVPIRLSDKYPGKVFVHYFRQDQKSPDAIHWDYDRRMVQTDRTKIIDALVADINARDILYNLTSAQLDEYIRHCVQLYRVVEETPQGISRPRWKTIEGRADHYFFATLYWRIALELTLGQGGIVETPGGAGIVSTMRRQIVSPDGTVPALDLKESARRAMNARRRSENI